MPALFRVKSVIKFFRTILDWLYNLDDCLEIVFDNNPVFE